MKNALKLTSIALLLALSATAVQSVPATGYQHRAVGTCTVSEPDPSDCPFCGGNPTLHIRMMFAMERVTMGVYTTLLH
jgi:hypothetical protein